MRARKYRNTRISRNTWVSKKTRKNRKSENVLQNTLHLQAYSRQNKDPKWVKKPLFMPLCVSFLSHFSAYNLHLAPFFLSISLPARIFFKSNYSLLAPKTPLFNGHFALFSHVQHGSKRFCLYNCYGYLCFLSRI